MELFKDANHEQFVGSLISHTNLPCFGMWPLLYRVTFLHLVSLTMLANTKTNIPVIDLGILHLLSYILLTRNSALESPSNLLHSFGSWAGVLLNF